MKHHVTARNESMPDGSTPPVVVYALIVNTEGQVLMVKNAGRNWSLPGGKREPSETIERAVQREAYEEAGAQIAVERVLRLSDAMHEGRLTTFIVLSARLLAIGDRVDVAEIEAVSWKAVNEASALMPWYPGGVASLLASSGAPYQAEV